MHLRCSAAVLLLCGGCYLSHGSDRDADHAIAVSVTGAGRVESSPEGISCPPDCTAAFPEGQEITLTARGDTPSVFVEWRDECDGSTRAICRFEVDAPARVGATFRDCTDRSFAHQLGTPTSIGIIGAGLSDCGQTVHGVVDVDVAFELGPRRFDPTGERGSFVGRLAMSGDLVWARHLRYQGELFVPWRPNATPDGSAYVMASYTGSARVIHDGDNEIVVEGGHGIAVIKYNPAGTLEWTRTWQSERGVVPYLAMVSPVSDDLLFLLSTTGNETVIPVDWSPPGAVSDNFNFVVGRLGASSGTLEWARLVGGPGVFHYGMDIVHADDDSIVITGICSDGVDFGAGPVFFDDSRSRVFVAKYTATGTYEWATVLPLIFDRTAPTVAALSSGSISLIAALRETVAIGERTLAADESGALISVRLRHDGSIEGADVISRPVTTRRAAQLPLPDDRVLTWFPFSEPLVLGDDMMMIPGDDGTQSIVITFDRAGRILGRRTLGSAGGFALLQNVTLIHSTTLVLTGGFLGDLELEPGSLGGLSSGGVGSGFVWQTPLSEL